MSAEVTRRLANGETRPGNVLKEHELITRGWKPKHQQTPEGSRSLWNQPITRRFSKKQPV